MGTERPFRRGAILAGFLAAAALVGGCLSQQHLRHQTVTVSEAARALEVAMSYLGSPYEWGGRRPPAFDSSGIITWSYRQVISPLRLKLGDKIVDDLPHRYIYKYNFEPLPLTELQPGDLVYLTDGTAEVTHGAMFVRWVKPYEVMEFLDASSRLGEVTIQEWPVGEEVRGQRLVAVGRLKVVR